MDRLGLRRLELYENGAGARAEVEEKKENLTQRRRVRRGKAEMGKERGKSFATEVGRGYGEYRDGGHREEEPKTQAHEVVSYQLLVFSCRRRGTQEQSQE
jgi:hypothetical protein